MRMISFPVALGMLDSLLDIKHLLINHKVLCIIFKFMSSSVWIFMFPRVCVFSSHMLDVHCVPEGTHLPIKNASTENLGMRQLHS